MQKIIVASLAPWNRKGKLSHIPMRKQLDRLPWQIGVKLLLGSIERMSSTSKWLTGPRNDDRSRPAKRKGGFCWSRTVSLWESDGCRRSKGTQPCNPFASLCAFPNFGPALFPSFFSWKASSFVILTHRKWGRIGLLRVRWVEEEDRCLVSSWQVAQTWHVSF